jgi:predicted nicotinamide N-methyase
MQNYNYHKTSVNYFLNLNSSKEYKKKKRIPNETIFRMLSNNNFIINSKNILDIGMGGGTDLIEFFNRGANIYGVDLRDKVLNYFCSYYKINRKNFFQCDLNNSFPNIKSKFDLIYFKDVLYYIDPAKHFSIIDSCKKILKNNGYILIQYIQKHFKKIKHKDLLDFDLYKQSKYKKINKYFDKKNPIVFLDDSHIISLIKYSKMILKSSVFDLRTHIYNGKTFIDLNRYIMLQKK